MQVPLDKINYAGRILSEFNGATTISVGDIALPVKAGSVTQQVLFSVVEDLAIQCYRWSDLATHYESSALNLPSNDQLLDQCQTY